MEYQSEIRDSILGDLSLKVEKKNYGKYLYKLRLNPVRGFENDSVTFDFPVTALIGPNGGGKTTVLGAAACAYISVKPGRFFTKSGKLDNSMQNWKISYELIDKEISPKELFSRTAKFTNLKWTRERVARPVAIFGVSRTVPASERNEFRKCASTNFKYENKDIKVLEPTVISAAEKILGKNLAGYSRIKVGASGKVSFLKGQTESGIGFSEFHFGAGESSIIKMLIKIESLQENALILIEEIENGLHPLATIRMVEYLIDIAYRKKIQAIFTTHSNDALLPLPPKAIWSAMNKKLYQGKLDVKSLRAITGQVNSRLAIFVEDYFAKVWVETIIASCSSIDGHEIDVYGMAGDGTSVTVNHNNNINPSKKCPSICIIDGDSAQTESDKDSVYRLPGEMPESYIFDQVMELIDGADSKIGELTVALHRPFEKQNDIREVITKIGKTCRDRHLIFNQIGKEIGFVSEIVVVSAFLNLWIQYYKEDVQPLLDVISNSLYSES